MMTCEVCRPWMAATWEQHETRLRDLRALDWPPARCPRCNGIDWVTAPPPLAKPREQGLSAPALVALALAAAVVTVMLVLFGRLA